MERKTKSKDDHLSPLARSILDRRRMISRRPLQEWVRALSELAIVDQARDQQAVGLGKQGTICFVVGFVFVIGTIALAETRFWFLPLTLLVITIGVGVALVIHWKRLKKRDLVNEFRNVILPFLRTIAEDIPERRAVYLKLDLAGPADDKKRSERTLPQGRFRKRVQQVFDVPWCKMEAPLASGGKLLLSIRDVYVVEKRSWKNASGKYKSKTKWKKYVRASAGLVAASGVFGFDRARIPASGDARFRLSERDGKQVLRMDRKLRFKAENERPEESVTVEQLLGMFFQLGSLAAPAQRRG